MDNSSSSISISIIYIYLVWQFYSNIATKFLSLKVTKL